MIIFECSGTETRCLLYRLSPSYFVTAVKHYDYVTARAIPTLAYCALCEKEQFAEARWVD